MEIECIKYFNTEAICEDTRQKWEKVKGTKIIVQTADDARLGYPKGITKKFGHSLR